MLRTAPALLALVPLLAVASEPTDDWWARVSREIVRSEYLVRAHDDRLHAANRAQDLRLWFRADGVEWMPRSVTDPPWTARMTLRDSIGVAPLATGDRVVYRHGSVVEEWKNEPTGLAIRIEGTDEAIYDIDTDLEILAAADREAVGFYHDGSLVVTLVPARDDGTLRLEIVDGSVLIEGDGDPIELVLTGSALAAATLGLAPLPDWSVESNQVVAILGAAVAPAGDVNGDGFSDVIVGAPRFDTGQVDEGRAFVYHGGPAGPSPVPAWVVDGDGTEARLGESVFAAGDVNGDGFGDVIVGVPSYSEILAQAGRFLVFLGSANGLDTSPDLTVDGTVPSGRLGGSVSWAGDVNGDGFSDVIVGAPFFNGDQTAEGKAWVYAGSAAGLSAAPLWSAEGNADFANFGSASASAGDVDGDGFADVIVGAPGAAAGEGNAFVFLGSPSGPSLVPDWTAAGGETPAAFGGSVGTAGDVNGDGFADVIVGAEFAGVSSVGRASVFLGSAAGPSLVPDWIAEGTESDGLFGDSVATAGDVNGDGFADVIVGASRFDAGDTNEGAAFVYLGSASGLATIPGWTGEGNANEARFGESVATAGDVNGDGFSDVIVGAPMFSNDQVQEGRAFVFVGSGDGPAPAPAWTIAGAQGGASFGRSVSSAGDVNGDGFSDMIVGASSFDIGAGNEGMVYVFHGSAAGLPVVPDWTAAGDAGGEQFGLSVASAGDVNGDGYGDVIVGSPTWSSPEDEEGRVSVFLGSPTGLEATAAWTAESDEVDAEMGTSVAGAGDVNGDGFGDVIAGAPRASAGGTVGGRAFVYHGSPAGPGAVPDWTGASPVPNARYGTAVTSAGDVNGDGFGDVVVGAPSQTDEQAVKGRVFAYLGSTTGLSRSPVWTAAGDDRFCSFGISVATAGDVDGDGLSDVVLGATCSSSSPSLGGHASLHLGTASGLTLDPVWSVEGDQARSNFGQAVAGAGDVNGDGFGDILVGAPLRGGPVFVREGRTRLYLGAATGPETSPAWFFDGGETDARLGESVAGAGDVDGDGFRDFVAGARFFGTGNEGASFVFSGDDGGGLARPVRQLAVGTDAPIGPLGRSDSDSGFRIEAVARSAAGRAPVRIEAEVDSRTVTGPLTDTGAPDTSGSSVLLRETVTGLTEGSFHRWRVRSATTSPLFPRTPWTSVPANGVTELKLRTAGDLPSPVLAPVTPGINQAVLPDSPPVIFAWNRGASRNFRIEWSRNPDFFAAVETSDVIADDGGGDIQVHVPDPESWRSILRLAQSPEIREIPVFWRIVDVDDQSTSGARTFRMATAASPTITAPVDGAEFDTTQAPRLIWDANHNERFQVRFSVVPHLGQPRVIASPDFELTATNWIVPDEIWAQVVELSRMNPDGSIHYAVFAKDALDRTTWSAVRKLRVVGNPSITPPGLPESTAFVFPSSPIPPLPLELIEIWGRILRPGLPHEESGHEPGDLPPGGSRRRR